MVLDLATSSKLTQFQIMGHDRRILACPKPHSHCVHLVSGAVGRETVDLSLTYCDRMGIQTYWGGQAIKIVLGAVIGPKYAYMSNSLPLSANVDTCSLVSFFIFLAIFCPMLLIPPEKLQLPLKVCTYFQIEITN